MARDHERDGVPGARPGHGPRGRGPSESARDLSVRSGGPVGDRLERVPHRPLERRGPDVDRQRDVRRLPAQVARQGRRPRPEPCVVPVDLGRRVLRSQGGLEILVRLPEADGADAAGRGGHEQAAERRCDERVADPHPPPAPPVGGRGHPQAGRGPLVQPAARPEARVVQRTRHRLLRPQARLEEVQPAGVGVPPRRDAHDAGEQPTERARARARVGPGVQRARERGQAERLVQVLLDVPADPLDRRDAGVGGRVLVRPAPPAGAEPGPLGLLGPGEEHDLGPARAAGRARRPAVDARGPDRKHEGSVGPRVARQRGAPAAVVVPPPARRPRIPLRRAPVELHDRSAHRPHLPPRRETPPGCSEHPGVRGRGALQTCCSGRTRPDLSAPSAQTGTVGPGRARAGRALPRLTSTRVP